MVILAGLAGLIVGSFLNAVIWRLKVKKSIVSDRSACPHCHHQLAWYDLVPVLSWLSLGGRCRYCRKPISWQYPLMELATAGLFAGSYALVRPGTVTDWLTFILWLYALASLVGLAVYDLRWYELPDRLLLPAMAVAGLSLVIQLGAGRPVAAILGHVLAAVLAGGSFYALVAVSKGRWMGGGDIKLALLMGLLLGPAKTLVALVLGFNAAAVVGVTLIALGRKSRKDYLPFGPFLVGGTLVSSLWGGQLIGWYLSLVYRL